MGKNDKNRQAVTHGASSAEPPRGKLMCYDWLADVPGGMARSQLVEVQFKNTRKAFYRNTLGLDLAIGDMVAVEAAPGHDVGQVTLTGCLVLLQMKKAGVKHNAELKRVFRRANAGDLEKYREARARENDTMIRARRIAESMKLNMKIGDVEYQGDGNKAIFYYIADERVDFRQLIKVFAETFKVRIEMKQIGARQEAGRIGGIGPCGRPLCCASWMTSFVSVGTVAARYQDISLNPQKLAGQCAKLKCCINFEIDSYVESIRHMPSKEIRLETDDALYYHFKYDVFKREITYSTDKNIAANLVTIDADRAFEVIAMNKRGEKPLSLMRDGEEKPDDKKTYNDILGQDITRFDKKKKKKRSKGKGSQQADGEPAAAAAPGREAKAPAKQERQPKRREERREERKKEEKAENSQRGEESKQPREQRQRKGGSQDRRSGKRNNRLRPGDTPDNAAPGEGRNASRDIQPAMSPSRRMLSDDESR